MEGQGRACRSWAGNGSGTDCGRLDTIVAVAIGTTRQYATHNSEMERSRRGRDDIPLPP